MKILYIGGDSQATGASFSMIKLIEEEEKLGIQVVPVVHKGNTDNLLNEKGKSHYVVNSWSWMVSNDATKLKVFIYRIIKEMLNLPCFFQYRKIIRNENPDIVHVNALTTYTGAQAAVKSEKPLVWHIREMMEEDLNGRFWSKKQAYMLMEKASYFIAISKCVEEKYKQIVDKNKIKCIYNGVDRDLFYDKDHMILVGSRVIITMAGRITKEKGQLLCLETLVPLLKNNPNIILRFVGTGNKKDIEDIVKLREYYAISELQVQLLGFVKDMKRIWSETDIAIVYSKFEAFGRVTVEAKMAGALVVGYDSGGTSELIEDTVDGYLFNEKDKKLNDIISFILEDKLKGREIAAKGRERACKIFTSENNAKQIYNLYQEVLQER